MSEIKPTNLKGAKAGDPHKKKSSGKKKNYYSQGVRWLWSSNQPGCMHSQSHVVSAASSGWKGLEPIRLGQVCMYIYMCTAAKIAYLTRSGEGV